MLFIQSNSLSLSLNERERLDLLDALAARGHRPLVRASRQRFFQLLMGEGRDAARSAVAASELEREYAAERESEAGAAYTPGDLFSAGDCVLSLVFGADGDESLSAGIIYNVETAEPLGRLDHFRRDVCEALGEVRGVGACEPEATEQSSDAPRWQTRSRELPRGLARFIAVQPADFVRAAGALRGGRELGRASELMEERAVRLFLRRVQEMRREGFTPRRLFAEAGVLAGGVSLDRMLDAGLLEREVRVSCRKSGHALFDLPSPDSLAAVTISRAKCSLCATPVADEVIEETLNPTRLAVALLEDGRWLSNRVYKIVRSLGVPESDIATGPASTHGESQLAVEACGDSFLFITRDGDLTPAFSRRAAECVEETEATHLVVVVTGVVEDEARMRLYEFAWRRARAGLDVDTTIIEGLDTARARIERAFERCVRRELSRHLFTLDAALGFSAAHFVLDWFKLTKSSGAKKQAADALTPLFLDLNQQVAS